MASNESISSNEYGTPPSGSPLYAATISVEDMERSRGFYTSALGLDVVDSRQMSGLAFERHWGLPSGIRAEVAVLADRDCRVGQVVLVEFKASGRQRVRNIAGQRFFGLVNLNFYSDDIGPHTQRLETLGCRPWSEPIVHDMGLTIGQPIEVMIDGPDGIILNLIELRASNPEARILRTMAYIAANGGYNRCGTTAVATSQHCVPRYEAAMAFNTRVMGMSVRNDTVLAGAGMEHFMGYPFGARTRDTYLQGNHVFGKIAINHPLNFDCVDLVPRAVAPNIGFIAQTFVVADLPAALAAAASIDSEIFSDMVELDLPALGRSTCAIVRNPGSGALHELVQPI